jgi:hypothetical protein
MIIPPLLRPSRPGAKSTGPIHSQTLDHSPVFPPSLVAARTLLFPSTILRTFCHTRSLSPAENRLRRTSSRNCPTLIYASDTRPSALRAACVANLSNVVATNPGIRAVFARYVTICCRPYANPPKRRIRNARAIRFSAIARRVARRMAHVNGSRARLVDVRRFLPDLLSNGDLRSVSDSRG